MNINRVGSAILPAAFYTKLRYTERVVLTSTLGLQATALWRGNSPFDPNFSGVGISAVGFATFANLYEKYRVFGSKITLKTVLTTSTGSGAYEIGLIPVNNGFAVTPTPEVMGMNSRGQFKIVGNDGGGSRGFASAYCSTAAIQGMKKLAIKIRDESGAAVTANPADQWYWSLATQPCDHSSDQSIAFYVSITYYVKFEDRRPFDIGS